MPVNNIKVQGLKAIIDDLTPEERRELARHLQPCLHERRLTVFDLPGEIRNRIYRYAITPEVIETHAFAGRAPALMKTNRTIALEFMSIYYSTEVFQAKMCEFPSKTWYDVFNPAVFQKVVASWSMCFTLSNTFDIANAKEWVEKHSLWGSGAYRKESIFHGFITWHDKVDGRVYTCMFDSDAKPRSPKGRVQTSLLVG